MGLGDFFGDMPQQYSKAAAQIAKRIRRLEDKYWIVSGDEFDELCEELALLRDMYEDAVRVSHTTANYYRKDVSLDPRYTLTARRPGKRASTYFEGSLLDIDAGGKTREANPPPAPNLGG
jgi:hypothetical protein